jgi:polysaccharide biosynthesis/export protein
VRWFYAPAALARLFVLTVLLAFAPAPLAAQDAAPAAQDPPVLAPGDVLRVTVFRKDELSGEINVADDGTLLHPLYRSLHVAGLPAPELERRVREFLTRYEAEPSFVIEPLVRITVGGEVRQPNVYTVRPSTTAFQAVATAGGATDRGRYDRVGLLRDGRTERLDLRPGQPDGVLRVRSGDVLVVERRSTAFREYIAPAASVLAVIVSVINLLSRESGT